MFSSRTTLVAALLAAGLLSGCGAASSNSSSPNATTPTTTAPGQGQFNPGLVPSVTTSTTSTTTTTKSKTKPKTPAKKAGGRSTGAARAVHTGSAGGSSGTGDTSVSSGGGGGHTVTVTRTVTVTKTHTVTRYRNHTVVVAPKVPTGAHMPSAQPALSFSRFSADGGNIGCALGGGAVRCDIVSRGWRPPAKPGSCQYAWGQGLTVGPSGSAHFVCAGDTVLDPTGPVVPVGRDDRIGSVTCQVRSFGVTCFDGAGSGFFISRTGYDTF